MGKVRKEYYICNCYMCINSKLIQRLKRVVKGRHWMEFPNERNWFERYGHINEDCSILNYKTLK